MKLATARVVAGAVGIIVAVFVLLLVVSSYPGGPGNAAGPAPPPGDTAAAQSPGTASAFLRAAPAADPLGPAAAAYLSRRSGTVSVAVYDVRTGQSWRLGGSRPQAEASLVKLDILQTLLARRAGAPLASAGQALARAMIEDSDNDAATSLWHADGGAAGLTAYGKRAGLRQTVLSPCVTCAGFPWPGWGLTTSVPGDQLALLRQLVAPGRHPLLTASARSYVLSLMTHVTADQRWGVSGGVPAGVTVALKNGWLPLNAARTDWQVNSVGWLSGKGRDYLIAVLGTGSPSEQYGIDTVSHLSALVWSALRVVLAPTATGDEKLAVPASILVSGSADAQGRLWQRSHR
jgi:beta-lactamase class A